jgi:hypothetical protein
MSGRKKKRKRCVLPCAQESKSPGEEKSWYLRRVEKKRRDKRSCLMIRFVTERAADTKICDMPAVGPSQVDKQKEELYCRMSSDWKKKNSAEIKEVTADIERSSDIKKEPDNILPSCRVNKSNRDINPA